MLAEHFVFLISDDIKEDDIRCCLIAEREKQNPLEMKLVTIEFVKDKRSIIWENYARNGLYRFAQPS